MGRAYSDLMFTPGVREVQIEHGSREHYASFDDLPDRHDALTSREAQFIAEADHFFQATVSETGWPYVQHRGGPKGFLKVLDARTIGFADFRGNVQYLSVGYLRSDDRISIIVIDYPSRRRLKLIGRVQLVEFGESAQGDAAIDAVSDPAYPAVVERAFLIRIEGWDWNCPQHITRRYTEAEMETRMAPLRAEVLALKEELRALKAGSADTPPSTPTRTPPDRPA